MDISRTLCFTALERFSDNIALIEGDRQITYGELAIAADVFASKLGSERCLVFLEAHNSISAITAYIACLRAGHVVYLFGEADGNRLPALIETYQPKLLITQGAGECSVEWRHNDATALHPDLAVLLSTSGSTGSPKFVKLSKQNLTSNALSIAEYLGLGSDERAVTTLKFNYSYGLSVIHSHLAIGAALILTDDSVTTPGFWHRFEAYKATSFAGVPYSFEMLQHNDDWAKIPSLRYTTQAGGRLAPKIVRRMAELAHLNGWRFFVMYGQTEAAPRMAYLPPDRAIDHADCIGRAIPGGNLSLIGEDGRDVYGVNTPGQLVYTGPNVMMGYAVAAVDLATDDTPSRLDTGDIAVRTEEGLFRIIGRQSRFIKPFGVRINLDELQAQVQAQAPDTVCTGSDAQLVVAVPAATEVDTVALANWIGESFKLPPFMITILSLPEIPHMANGKVDYQAILRRVPVAEPAPEETGPAAKWSNVHDIFKALTSAKTVSPDSSFITLAGDSLSYVITSLAIEDYLGFLPSDWESLTVAQLEALKNGEGERSKATNLHSLNSSRLLLLLLGIPYHTIMLFISPSVNGLPAPFHSIVATILTSIFHSFRMSAFFFISGYFSMLLIRRAKISKWLNRQTIRLGLPTLAGSLVLAPIEMAAALGPTDPRTIPLNYWVTNLTPPHMHWLNHRWFLVTLLNLAVILAGIVALKRAGWLGRWIDQLRAFCGRHLSLIWSLFLLALAPTGMVIAGLHNAYGAWFDPLGFFFDPFGVANFAPAFFAGGVMLLQPDWFEKFLKPSITSVTATILTIIIFVASVNPGTFFERVVQHACLIPAGLLGTQLVVSLMKRWAVYSHPVITRLIDASLVIYLWHMVFVLFFGSLFLRMQLGLWTASIATTMAAFACSWLVYLGVSRSRSLSLIFNGGPLRGK